MRGQSSITFSELQTDPRSVIIVSRQTPLPPSLRRIGEFLQARWPDIRVRVLGNERHLSDALRTEPPDLLLLAEEVADQRLLALASEQMSPRTHVARIRESGALETLFLSLPTLSGTDCLAGRVVDLLERRSRNQAKRRLHKLQLDRLTRKNERLKQLSVEDPLTRVFNRRGFHRFFRAEWSRASRYHADIACVLVDIDDFKRLNDTYGHPLGDRVLRRFADMLRSSCRASDILGRIGGEEFCIALPSCNEHQAYLWAEKLRRRIEATPLYAETATIRVTASFGVASAQATLRDEHELIELADRAMLIAKHSGRNRVVAASTTQGGKPGETKLHPASRIVRLLLESLAIRDPATASHSQRVSQYATLLAKQIGLAENEIWVAEVAGLLHDIGKMGVPDRILQKPSPLETNERQVVTDSLASSHDFVRNAFGDGPLSETIRCCRIWFRDAQEGKRLPMAARIVAIADAYDSMTSPHTYRKPLTRAEASAELLRCAGEQFDGELVREFSAMLDAQS